MKGFLKGIAYGAAFAISGVALGFIVSLGIPSPSPSRAADSYLNPSTPVVNGAPVSSTNPMPTSGGGAVTITDGGDQALGAKADSACGSDTGTCTLIALTKRLQQTLTTLNGIAAASIVLPVNVTPTDCSGSITTGGTAQTALAAQTTLHGFTIANIDTSEVLWFSTTGTAAASTAGSYPLAPATATTFAGLSSFTAPPGFGTNHALSAIATTTGHKWSCTWW